MDADHEPGRVGGKAERLTLLSQEGYEVPPFAVIPREVLENLFPAALRDGRDPSALRSLIETYPLDEDLIDSYLPPAGPGAFWAVRSSADGEDADGNSFAGMFATELFVPREDLSSAVRKVWLSVLSDRVTVYRKRHGLPFQAGIAVIIQEMIAAEVSGVVFGLDPVTGDRQSVVINAIYGLGEGLVSGELEADRYTVSFGSGSPIIARHTARKEISLAFDASRGRGLRPFPVPYELQSVTCLTDDQVLEVASLARDLYRRYSQYQDIEFCYRDGRLFLLQARPVTGLDRLSDGGGKTIVWDNSNIVESYPGLTLPLTFSFIRKMYGAVYTQLSHLLGIEPAVVAAHSDVYDRMLGLINGRVYYNLSNWHRALALLPGYRFNAGFMDAMMGVKEKFSAAMPERSSGLREVFRILRAALHLLVQHGSVEPKRRAFRRHLDAVLAQYDGMDFSKRRLEELVEDYKRFERTLVRRWKPPLVNDFFAMVHFGLLRRLLESWGLPQAENLHNDLVTGARDIISTEPVERTLELSSLVLADPALKDRFLNSDPQVLWRTLEADQGRAAALVRGFIQRWGDRVVGELKLETITYRQQPWEFLKVVREYVARGLTPETVPLGSRWLRRTAEKRVREALRGHPLRRMLFRYVLKKARYFITHRENLRFDRTRGFGLVRRIFLEIGARLHAEGHLAEPREVFYLSQEEVFDFVLGLGWDRDLKALVSLRRQQYQNHAAGPAAQRIVTRGAVPIGNVPVSAPQELSDLVADLRGTGCSAGRVTAPVHVMRALSESDGLAGRILVTASTDPGWVCLFPTVSGILVERGSLLSHSAIVAREMGLPCVVGITGLLDRLATGDLVEMDGAAGTVRILSRGSPG